MSEEYFWIKDTDGGYSAGYVVQEGEDGTCVFEEFETGRRINGDFDSIVGSVAPPCEDTLSDLKDDLVQSDDISEPSILWNLSRKFSKGVIYSSIGTILVSVNPYQFIDSMYSDEVLQNYIDDGVDQSMGNQPNEKSAASHIWSVAKNTYVHLCTQGQNAHSRQAVVISGESGSGKTEATKKLMTYLSAISSATGTGAAKGGDGEVDGEQPIADKVMGMNPLLESFGNAKTLRNDNSSRFGRWLQIHFKLPSSNSSSLRPRLTGADISEYLLEKSRVVGQAKGERNYHIFFQLLTDEANGMEGPETYAFLNTSECLTVDGMDDAREYKDTLQAFHSLGMGSSKNMVLSALKGILFLGNLLFENHVTEEGDGSRITDETQHFMVRAAECFALQSADALHTALTVRSVVVRNEKIDVFLTPKQASDARNALAKEVYALLFKFIVAQANKSLMPPDGVPQEDVMGEGVIGLLDIFGFEIFQNNSLEQLSINFANEKLQAYFLHYVLKREQDLYEAQGVHVERIVPKDNEDVLLLMETPRSGIFARLDEELKLPKPSDTSFLRKVEEDRAAESTVRDEDSVSRFCKNVKMPATHFEIIHFAGTVRYDSTGFVEKNRDKLYEHMQALLQDSTSEHFRMILPKEDVDQKAVTLLKGFQNQLASLMQTLRISEPHFVRCIKPNGRKLPRVLDEVLVLEQLRYSGVLEAIQVRKRGYPIRRTLEQFYQAYWVLSEYQPSSDFWSDTLSAKDKCSIIMDAIISSSRLEGEILLGESLVLMRRAALTFLEGQMYTWKIAMCLRLQCRMRSRIAGRKYALLSEARLQLTELVRQSKFRNSTNYAVAQPLAEMIRYSKEKLGMKCFFLKEAEEQSVRLMQVKDLADEAKHRASADFSRTVRDIVSEHSLILETLAQAESLQMNVDHSSVEVEALIAREIVIRLQAVSLGKLRAAIANCNQENIETLLVEVAEVAAQTNAGESFSSADELSARNLLKQLRQDEELVDECVQKLVEFQHAYEAKRGTPDAVSWLVANASSYGADAARLLKTMRANPSTSATIRLTVTILFEVASSLQHWMDNKWSVLADVISGIMDGIEELKDIPTLNSGDLASDFKSRRVSKKEYDRIHAYIAPIVDAHVAYLASDLELNFVVPRLADAYKVGRLPMCEDVSLGAILAVQHTWTTFAGASSNTVDLHLLSSKANDGSSLTKLYDAIEKTRMYHWLSEPVLLLLQQLEIIANIRNFTRLHYFDMVLRQTETTEDTKEYESQFMGLLHKVQACPASDTKKIVSKDVGEWKQTLSAPEHARELLRPYVEYDGASLQGIDANRFEIALEVSQARSTALLQKSFHLICHALSRGLATGANVSDLDPKSLDVRSLEIVIGKVGKLSAGQSAVKAMERMLTQLAELRSLLMSGSDSNADVWQAVIDNTSKSDFFVPPTSNVRKFLSENVAAGADTSWDNVSHAILALRDEVVIIVAACKCNLATKSLRAAFFVGNFLGIADASNTTEQLVESIEAARWCTTGPMGVNGASQDLQTLLQSAELLLDARHAFSQEGEVSLQRSAVKAFTTFFAGLEKTSESTSTSYEVDADERSADSDIVYWSSKLHVSPLAEELRLMRAITNFADCMDSIRDCLRLPSPVQYLVSINKPADPRNKANEPDGNSTDSSEDEPMISSSTPFGGGATTNKPSFGASNNAPFGESPSTLPVKAKPNAMALLDLLNQSQRATAMEAHRLVAEEKMRFNMDTLDTTKLDESLAVAKKLQKSLINVPAEQANLIRAAELIRLMRESVVCGKWRDANAAMGQLKDDGLITNLAIIHEEALVAAETIQSYIVISVCREALKKGTCQGPTGLINYANLDVSTLEDVLHECSSAGCGTSQRAQELIKACWLILDLRKAQKNGDWTHTKEVLRKCDTEGVARPGSATAICYEEVTRANIEANNWDCLNALKGAIIAERIPTVECLIEVPKVTVTSLSETYLAAQELKVSHRGAMLVELLSLSDLVLKTRKAIQQSNWFAVNSVVTLCRQEVDEFRFAIESLEIDTSTTSSNAIVSRRFSIVRRSSVLSNSPRKGSKGSSLESDTESAAQKPTIVPVKAYELWAEFSEMHDSLVAELCSIDNHFATLELETAIYTALRENGMTNAMVGNVDRHKIKNIHIETCQENARKHEARGLILSQTMKNVFKASELITSIRKCIVDDTWDIIPNILEETVTGGIGSSGTASNHVQQSIPDMCRKELEAVRHEIENRWIISSIKSSLEYGQLAGTLEEIDYSQVSFEHLVACISSCKDLSPRTDVAKNLIYTAEIVVPMRKLLKARNIDYYSLREKAADALSPAVVSLLNHTVIAEVRFVHSFADDYILCSALEGALRKYGPIGVPGQLDTSSVSTAELDRVLILASSTTIKTEKAAGLLNACRTAKSLRTAVLRTSVADPIVVAEAWGTIRQIVMKLHDAHRLAIENFKIELVKKKAAAQEKGDEGMLLTNIIEEDPEYKDLGWDLYEDEVTLITRDAHITEVRVNLEESIEDSLKTYAKRTGIAINPAQDWQELPTKHSKQKVTAAGMMLVPAKFDLSTVSLAKLVNYAQNLDFKSDFLNSYIDVCIYLKSLRQNIMNGRWADLEGSVYTLDSSLLESMNRVPLSFTELEMARAEYLNHEGTNLLVEALLAKGHTFKKDDIAKLSMMKGMGGATGGFLDAIRSSTRAIDRLLENASVARENEIPVESTCKEAKKSARNYVKMLENHEPATEDHTKALNLNPDELSCIHQGLLDAIRIAKKLPLTSLMANQLVDTATYVFQLRVGLSDQHSREVIIALKWMRQNSRILPKFVQEEAKDAYVAHQNYLLELGLNRALLTGHARGSRGYSDSNTIVVDDLAKLLDQAKELKASTSSNAAVMELINAAEDILLLRKALKKRNFLALHDGLDGISQRRLVINPLIMTEVFSFKTELNNEISIVVLQCALTAFGMDTFAENKNLRPAHGSGSGTISDSFLRVAGNTMFANFKSQVDLTRKTKKGQPLDSCVSLYFDGNARAYCPYNIHHADVDPETITVDLLSEAEAIAGKCGVYSDTCIRLYKTVKLVHKLRLLMKEGDWSKVEETLRASELMASASDIASSMELLNEGNAYSIKIPISVDPFAAHELVLIQNQLEIRAAIAEVHKCLKVGWARCSNGIVGTEFLELDRLRSAVRRCKTSVLGEDSMRGLMASFGIAEAKSAGSEEHASQKTASAAQAQVELLLKSAEIVLKVRQSLRKKKNLAEAGALATDALKENLHASVIQELSLYSKEVYRALKINALESELRVGMVKGDMESLEALILQAREVTSMQNVQLNDLGLVLILKRAQTVYKAFCASKRALRKSVFSFNQAFIENALECAQLLHFTGPLVVEVEHHLSQLNRFEMFVIKYRREHHGALTEDSAFHEVLSKANDLGMIHHPWAHEASVCLRLTNESLRTLMIANSVANDNNSVSQGELKLGAERVSGQAFIAATETMRLKRHFLSDSVVRKHYALEKFPFLRVPKDFALRMSLANKKVMTSMIHHIDQSLGTSLTVLSPELSALSVWMFGHCIRGIERSIYTRIELLLKKIVCLGRLCVRMRDEILLQIIKQLRANPISYSTATEKENMDGSTRLWRSLCACLAHFPPSSSFESYLELFLLTQVEESTVIIANLNAAIKEREANAGKNTSGIYAPTQQTGHRTNARRMENKEDEMKIKIVLAKSHRDYARFCVRLLHESIFIYGYDRKIVTPFGCSLKDMHTWLAKDDIRALRVIHKHTNDHKSNFDSILRAAVAEKKQNELMLGEDPGWSAPTLKSARTLSSIRRLLLNAQDDDDEDGPQNVEDVEHRPSTHLTHSAAKNVVAAGKFNIGKKLGRILSAKRQSMVLDVGSETMREMFSAAEPGLSESKPQKQKGKVGFLSSKLNTTVNPLSISERKEDFSVGLTTKDGGIEVMTKDNMSKYVNADVVDLIAKRNAIFGNSDYWKKKLLIYKSDYAEDDDIDLMSVRGLCLKITGKPIGSSSWGASAASKLFCLVSADQSGSSTEVKDNEPFVASIKTIEDEIILYLVTGRPVTRMTEVFRLYRIMISGSFNTHSDHNKRIHGRVSAHDSSTMFKSAATKSNDVNLFLDSNSHSENIGDMDVMDFTEETKSVHAITGSFFFTDEENSLSDNRTTFLRRSIMLYKDHSEKYNAELGQEATPASVQKFWNNVINYSAENFEQKTGTRRESLIDHMLFRDLICVGLDLLISEVPPSYIFFEELEQRASMQRASIGTLKMKHEQEEKYSRLHPPRPPRVNDEGYHIYRKKM